MAARIGAAFGAALWRRIRRTDERLLWSEESACGRAERHQQTHSQSAGAGNNASAENLALGDAHGTQSADRVPAGLCPARVRAHHGDASAAGHRADDAFELLPRG